MYKLDLKDRKILYELDLNCRQSNTQIGKKVGLKKDVVNYRIKKMEEDKVIKGYFTAIDTFKLGFNVYRIYLNFQDISVEEKKELIKEFVDYKNSWAVYSITGPIDLGVVSWVNNVYDFYNFLNKILDNHGKYIAEKNLSIHVGGEEYEKSYLLPTDYQNKNRVKFTLKCTGEKVEIDELDYNLLNMLVENARMPLIDLADKVKTTSQTVQYRLKNLIKMELITGFRVNVDESILGLQYFDVRINLTDHSFRKKLIEYLSNTPYLKCINNSFGYADLELELILENMDRLIETMDGLQEKFPRVIRNYHLLKTKETFKERWLPKMLK